jgi:RNase P protein component
MWRWSLAHSRMGIVISHAGSNAIRRNEIAERWRCRELRDANGVAKRSEEGTQQ